MGLRPCLRQSSSTINSWWRTWLSWSSCRPNLQHEFAALKVLHKVFHVGWTDLRLASTTALTTSAATATRLFLSTTLHSLPPTWSERLVQVQVPHPGSLPGHVSPGLVFCPPAGQATGPLSPQETPYLDKLNLASLWQD